MKKKKDESPAGSELSAGGSGSGRKETIGEFFKRIGIPFEDVTEEMAGKTQIFLIPRPPKKEKDQSPGGEGE